MQGAQVMQLVPRPKVGNSPSLSDQIYGRRYGNCMGKVIHLPKPTLRRKTRIQPKVPQPGGTTTRTPKECANQPGESVYLRSYKPRSQIHRFNRLNPKSPVTSRDLLSRKTCLYETHFRRLRHGVRHRQPSLEPLSLQVLPELLPEQLPELLLDQLSQAPRMLRNQRVRDRGVTSYGDTRC